MNKIYTEVNKASNGKFADLRFPNIAFGADGAVVTVKCPHGDLQAVEQCRSELTKTVRDICSFNCDIKIQILEENLSKKVLRDCIAAFMQKFSFAADAELAVDIDPPSIKLTMHKSMYSLAKDSCLPRLDEYLKNNFTVPVKVNIETVEYSERTEREEKTVKTKKSYSVKNLVPIVGTVNVREAMSIGNSIDASSDIVVCGILTMLTEYMSKSRPDTGSTPYELFTLSDGDRTLACRYYPKDGASLFKRKSDILNKAVCVSGYAKSSRFGEVSLTVSALALCDAEGLDIPSAPHPCSDYDTVAPVPYQEYVQASLFQSEEKLPDSLRGTFVVFDFETTGLSLEYDMPTEIGAVKLIDGVITETFSTFIDPQRPIPPEVSAKTGITDDMVKGKPLLEDVLPDFYKFTYGCGLVCHNVSFDFPFLLKHGNRYGWTFGDRATYDTMGYAPIAIPGIDKLNLDRVLEGLGLVNDNAHRALSDAIATAKAFIAMMKIIGNRH